METIAISYLELDTVDVETIRDECEGDKRKYKREILRLWRNQNVSKDKRSVSFFFLLLSQYFQLQLKNSVTLRPELSISYFMLYPVASSYMYFRVCFKYRYIKVKIAGQNVFLSFCYSKELQFRSSYFIRPKNYSSTAGGLDRTQDESLQ